MIYLDNAATTYPKPECIIKAVRQCVEEYGGNPGRGSHRLAALAAERIYELREEAASLLKLPCPENMILVPNATYALNLAIKTRARQGSHILISDQEHNAVRRPVLGLVRRGVVTCSVYSSHGNVYEHICNALRPSSDILICNPVSNVTGHTIPLSDVMRAAKEHRLYLIVDASQWLGHTDITDPIDEIDALCIPGHKGLYGLQGSGLLYLRSSEGLTSFLEGGSGTESRSERMPSALPERYEAGTLSTPCAASLLAGIRFVKEMGLGTIDALESALSRRTHDILRSIDGIRVWGREDGGGSVLSFSHESVHPDHICDELDKRGICTRAGLHCAPMAHSSAGTDRRGTVRISFGVFNSAAEIDALYKVLKEIIFRC